MIIVIFIFRHIIFGKPKRHGHQLLVRIKNIHSKSTENMDTCFIRNYIPRLLVSKSVPLFL